MYNFWVPYYYLLIIYYALKCDFLKGFFPTVTEGKYLNLLSFK